MAFTIDVMFWLRLIPLLILCCLFSCVCCIICIVVATQGPEVLNQQRSRVNNVPVLNNFFASHSRRYNQDTDVDSQCAICLESFAESSHKDIAELDCSNKHIFHVECLKQWVEKNNECPLCREAILK